MELPSRIKNSSVVLIYLLVFICPRMVPEQASALIYLFLINWIPIEFTFINPFDVLCTDEECFGVIRVIRQFCSAEIHAIHWLVQDFFRFFSIGADQNSGYHFHNTILHGVHDK